MQRWRRVVRCASRWQLGRPFAHVQQHQAHDEDELMWVKAYATAIVSLLAGASVAHYILKPDLAIPMHSSSPRMARPEKPPPSQ